MYDGSMKEGSMLLKVPSVVISAGPSPLDFLIHAILPVLNATSCQNGHCGSRGADYTDARRLNDGIDEQRIPGILFNTCPDR